MEDPNHSTELKYHCNHPDSDFVNQKVSNPIEMQNACEDEYFLAKERKEETKKKTTQFMKNFFPLILIAAIMLLSFGFQLIVDILNSLL